MLAKSIPLIPHRLMFAGPPECKSALAQLTDQVDTQPVDVMVLTPPEPKPSVVSPEHSACAKREMYQAKGHTVPEPKPAEAPLEIPKDQPDVTPAPDGKKKALKEFTDSDEARAHACNTVPPSKTFKKHRF